ncbi:PLDc N-terminal domain-containing protein [Chloroflexota bacterium]
MEALGVLFFIGMLVPGIALVAVGVLGLRRRPNVMKTGLLWLAIAVGVSFEVLLGLSVVPGGVSDNTFPLVAVSAFGVAGFILWVTVLADCLVNESREGKERLVWAVVIVFTFVVGAGLYCLIRRPKRIAERSV